MPRVKVDLIELNVIEQGQGHPLLLVHGFPLNHEMWDAQLQAFGDSHRVIAPDLRGFGRSDIGVGTVTMEQFADDLNALLDVLGIDEPVSLCGLSMGGYVALEFVRKYGSRLRSLILCDTRSAADSPEAAENRLKSVDTVLLKGPEPIYKAMQEKLLAAQTRESRPQVVDKVREMILGTHPQAIAAAQRGMAERRDSTPLLSQISVPTLVLVGAEDAISPPDEMRQMAAAIPQSEFVLVPEAGHLAPMENPAAVGDALRSFLSKHA